MSPPPSPGYAPNSDFSAEEDDDDALGWKIQKPVPRSKPPPSQQLKPPDAHGDGNGNGNVMDAAGPSRKRQRIGQSGQGTSTPPLQQPHTEAFGFQPPPPHQMKPHHPLPGLRMKSFFGIQPVDEISDVIGKWLLQVCYGLSNVEIEFKLGTLIDKNTGQRLHLRGVGSEVVVRDLDFAFRSEMTMRQHKSLNALLNRETDNCSGRIPHPVLPPHHYYPITYQHIYNTDTSYPSRSRGRGRVRVTRDTDPRKKTSEIIAVVEKETIDSLHVFSPNEEFDWRVSVNVETPSDMPDTSVGPEMTREKDRLQYKHQFFQIDLTQVKATKRAQKSPTTIHELELEISNSPEFLTQGHLWTQGQPNVWEDSLECVVNTLRTLNRNAGPREG